jgi:hypothetical protein
LDSFLPVQLLRIFGWMRGAKREKIPTGNYPLVVNKRSAFLVLVILTALLKPDRGLQGQEIPGDLKAAQLEALTTGNGSGLSRIRKSSVQVQLTQRWTSMAAEMVKEVSADVDADGALLLSKFIYRGAIQFVRQGAPVQGSYLSEQNLRKFIDAEIQNGKKQNTSRPAINEAAFEETKRANCPLWPFC